MKVYAVFGILFLCFLVVAGMNVILRAYAPASGFEPMSFDWTDADLRSVFMLNATDGWAVGQGGTILHWDGAVWETVESSILSWLASVHMVDANDGWAVGEGGIIIHWNGTAWSEVASPTLDTLYGVYMVNATDGWAVGGTPGGSPSAVIIRWNGTAWNAVASPTSNWLRSVFMVNATEGWAVSGAYGTIIRWNGTAWKPVTSPTSSGFNSVFMVNASDGWATCFNGQIVRWDGTAWSNFSKPTSNSLRSIFMLNATDGWIVGDSDIFHWDGADWNSVTKPAGDWLFSVFMVDALDGWAVGDFGLILHWNGAEWVVSKSPVYLGDLYLSDSDVYVIEGIFNINGSIIVEENATLILRNAILNFTCPGAIFLQNAVNGNPRLYAENTTTLNADYSRFYENSSVVMSNCTMLGGGMYYYDETEGTILNSKFNYIDARDSATLHISNSTVEQLNLVTFSANSSISNINSGFFDFWNFLQNCSVTVNSLGSAPNVTLTKVTVQNWLFSFQGDSNAEIGKSEIRHLHANSFAHVLVHDSIVQYLEFYGSTVAKLTNSTYSQLRLFNTAMIYADWYLDVHVTDSIGQNVPSANVTVTYPNATVVESKLTDTGGWARLTLMEKMINVTDSYPVGNYTVTAFYEVHTGYQSVNMTGNQEITITLPFIIPEFPSFLLMPLFMVATLAVVLVFRRKHAPV